MTKPLPLDQRIARKTTSHPGRIVYATIDQEQRTHVLLYLKPKHQLISMASFDGATSRTVIVEMER